MGQFVFRVKSMWGFLLKSIYYLFKTKIMMKKMFEKESIKRAIESLLVFFFSTIVSIEYNTSFGGSSSHGA